MIAMVTDGKGMAFATRLEVFLFIALVASQIAIVLLSLSSKREQLFVEDAA